MEIVCGIDPGKYGGIVGLNPDGTIIFKYVIPLDHDENLDIVELLMLFSSIVMANRYVKFVLEKPTPFAGTSKASMADLYRTIGIIEASIVSLGYDYDLINPRKWQNVMWKPEDIETKSSGEKDTKATSLSTFRRYWTNYDIRFGDNESVNNRRKKPHDGLVDAALIALYHLNKPKDERKYNKSKVKIVGVRNARTLKSKKKV